MNDTPKAWLTRAGRYGERDAWALENGVTPGGYDTVPDLTGCQSLDDVRTLVAASEPDASPNAVGDYAAQLSLPTRRTAGCPTGWPTVGQPATGPPAE